MQLAFYAPLKPPGDPVPSGDRTMARGLIAALEQAGAIVDLASTLRPRDGVGDADFQHRTMAAAVAEANQLCQRGKAAGWQAWITYHNYYKAPDLIGPTVSRALGIPYLQIESTRAKKRLNGPWADYATAAETASDAAQVIFYLTARDAEALHRDAPTQQRLIHLPPFLARADLPDRSRGGPMLCVGMMREGDKLASYEIIAQTLAQLRNGWQMNIVGDGPARPQVAALMAPFGAAVTFLGTHDAEHLADVYQRADLLFWPGVNEAFGLTYLEAQATGLPVVAQDRPGVRDVLAPGRYPLPEDGVGALAAELTHLLDHPAERIARGQRARDHVVQHHLLPAAAQVLGSALADLGVGA